MTKVINVKLVTWTSMIDTKLTSVDLVSVETVDCRLTRLFCVEFAETHTLINDKNHVITHVTILVTPMLKVY